MIISQVRIYRVNGVTFEWHRWYTIIINRHNEKERPFRSISARNRAEIRKFCRMSDEEKEGHRIY